MAVTVAGIVCQELVADYTEGYDVQGGPTCTKYYLCPWANRFTVAHGFLGASSSPSLGGLITLKGVGAPVQGAHNIAWTSAIVGVTFGPFPWTFAGTDLMQLDPTRPYVWAEQHFSYSSETITIPGRKLFFKTTSAALDQNWGFPSPLMDMTVTCKQMPYLPAPIVLAALMAPINTVTYLGCPPGTLRFNGAQDVPTQAPDGTPTRDTAFSFTFRPIAPWDQVYNGAAHIWDQVVDATGNPILQRSDLSTLIPSAYYA